MTILAILLAGCGDDATSSDATSSASVKESASASSQSPAVLLLGKEDLPPGQVKSEALPEPCSPIDVLEWHGAEAAATPIYDLGSAYVGEAVGIAPTEKKAAAALEGMQTPKRLSCIQSTIESFGPREGVAVTIEQPEPIAGGEEGSMIRLLEVDAQAVPLNVTAIVSFRSGRCVATLLFLLESGTAGTAFVDNLVHRAYGALADADAACR